ncbi:MAG: hypothetical protein OHK005_05180 [Candidatus Methylacidiphilales bacterium]
MGWLPVLVLSGLVLAACHRGPESGKPESETNVEAKEQPSFIAPDKQAKPCGQEESRASVPGEPVTVEAVEAAVRSGNPQALAHLLASGLDRPTLDAALSVAVREDRASAVGTLLEHGADPNLRSGGAPLLAWALAGRSVPIVTALVRAGAEVNTALPAPAPEALITAVGDESFAYYLRRERNVTLLMLAAATGQVEAVRTLIEAGAARNAKTAKHQTTAIWLAGKRQHVEIVQLLLGKDPSPAAQVRRIEISLSRQRATLWENGEPLLGSPISSGKKGFATPKGRFVVTNKYRDWKSTLYEDAPMPYFMRLSCLDFGLHAGKIPGYPASHGCVRLPQAQAKGFFEKTDIGTLVEIID